ncbi:hypothetical protein B0O99DRAFT_644800 [Bisporella sp. PMI_857]|nr:hypothetical protein B0O99DRAFT_644800 [Bisporella sp. PMI_857]
MAFTQYIRSTFNRTFLSYSLDWLIIVIFLGIAGAFSILEPVKRDFSLTDRSISFPYRKDTISMPLLVVVAVIAPAAIIAASCIVFARLPARPGTTSSRSAMWKRKLWELHAAWLGLALSITISLFITQTLKNMFGKHRPDFLVRCNPDIFGMSKYVVGGYTSEALEGTSQLVRWDICISKNGSGVGKSEFIDGFRSFPSGHCTSTYITHVPHLDQKAYSDISVAFAGLTYLSLFLATKFSAIIPELPPIS